MRTRRVLFCVRWLQLASRSRAFSSRNPERVDVKCASAGHVTVDLFNAPEKSPETALLVHLPPYPSNRGSETRLPEFLKGLPVVSINYRWRTAAQALGRDDGSVPLGWPTPVHDTAIAFLWLVNNLAPPGNAKRDIYVFGSHLGASLATSLSLTEAHVDDRFGIRGVMAYNGIYNWTMFLPDHRINRLSGKGAQALTHSPPAEGSHIQRLRKQMRGLFDEPSNLFDPFASPSLFFHSPGLLVPRSFSVSTEDTAKIDDVAGGDAAATSATAPRRSNLVFPPRRSTLRIPETLLLHNSPPRTAAKSGQANVSKHTFAAQAKELAEMMRRSIHASDKKEHGVWDEDTQDEEDKQDEEGEADQRVQVANVGPETTSVELSDAGQEVALAWLQAR